MMKSGGLWYILEAARSSGPAADFHGHSVAVADTARQPCNGRLQHPRRLHLRDWTARRSLPCKCILARKTQDEGDLLCSVWRSCYFMTHGANEIQPSPRHPIVDIGWRRPHNGRSVWVFLIKKKRIVRTSKLEKCLASWQNWANKATMTNLQIHCYTREINHCLNYR